MTVAEYRDVDKRKIKISDEELSARLGRVCSHKDGEISRVVETLIHTAEPRYAVTRVKLSYDEDGTVDLGFAKVKSQALVKNLASAPSAFIFTVTLGTAVDRLLMRLCEVSRAEAFIYDAVASALAESACNVAEEEIRGDLTCRPRFSPGYADFPIEHQGALLDFLGAPTHLGISVGDGCLMTPMKTITAVMGVFEG